ncbi:hypothetical protein DBR43_17145 [Pedobacter sp. KBW06]|uniref:serine hydrolase domain-containing protein n=1 Tax=Pedobacter sp. KBW06 TaxID=2153359 RepID=UPI000F59A2A7|nr:serine hydrolase domain-containing protein [Pedobacter sp. KBW06]RQO69785.1 hypothetical protein DBR43_17145 [Pedobacter sp. KBW06]
MKRNLLKLLVLASLFCACKKEKKPAEPAKPLPLQTQATEQQLEWLTTATNMKGVSVAVVDETSIRWQKSAGYADVERGIKLTDNHMFSLASLAKPVIGAIVIKLVKEGKLNLDKDVNSYLPFKIKNPHLPDDVITLRRLLSHSSGITDTVYNDILPEIAAEEIDSKIPVATFLKEMLTVEGRFYQEYTFDREKIKYHYSNTGAALAAYIVERVTGKEFDQYTTETLLNPLGLNKMCWHLRDLKLSDMSKNYDSLGAKGPIFTTPDYCAGGLLSDTRDLATLCQLFLNNGVHQGKKIWPDGVVSDMTKITYPKEIPDRGFFIDKTSLNGATVYGNNGTRAGYTAFMYWSVELKRGVVIIINTQENQQSKPGIKKLMELAFKI